MTRHVLTHRRVGVKGESGEQFSGSIGMSTERPRQEKIGFQQGGTKLGENS
jgi:hypothetical protein